MSDIEQKALEMISAARKEHPTPDNYLIARTALFRAIERHEAFRQEVSDAVEMALKNYPPNFLREHLHQFIIPKPEPDPLVEALHEVDTGPEWDSAEDYCNKVRAALDALGFEIRKKNDDYYE